MKTVTRNYALNLVKAKKAEILGTKYMDNKEFVILSNKMRYLFTRSDINYGLTEIK